MGSSGKDAQTVTSVPLADSIPGEARGSILPLGQRVLFKPFANIHPERFMLARLGEKPNNG